MAYVYTLIKIHFWASKLSFKLNSITKVEHTILKPSQSTCIPAGKCVYHYYCVYALQVYNNFY